MEGCDWVAVVPAHHTKTGRKYKWAMKRKVNGAVETVQQLHARGLRLPHIRDQHHLARMLYDWFDRRILRDAAQEYPVVGARLAAGNKYNMRSVRSRFATEWAAAKKQAEEEGKKVPENPL